MLKELLEMVDYVAKSNVNSILFTWDKQDNTIVHTFCNGTWKASEAVGNKKFEKLVSFMMANNIAEISNWDNFDAWHGQIVRFDGVESRKTAEIMAKYFAPYVIEKDGKYKLELKFDDLKIWASVRKEVYENVTKVAA